VYRLKEYEERKMSMNNINLPLRTNLYKQANPPKIGVVGLGYVGLPVAITFAEKFQVIGVDTNQHKIALLNQAIDPNGELSKSDFQNKTITYVSDPSTLRECSYIIIAVPTPVTRINEPDVSLLEEASKMVGENLAQHATVIYESTVYPGTTEDVCIPLLESYSGWTSGTDFQVGYSPERINPGDEEHTFKKIPKVIAGQTNEAQENMVTLYHHVLEAEVYQAPSIKVAEAAKIIENTQRDVNIAFMNELSLIFDKLDIDTNEVLHAANTKWNFLPFSPGLVGGHCIGVDPYYLMYKSKMEGYMPTLISAARTLNDSMPSYIVHTLLELVMMQQLNPQDIRITMLGITFKENISDVRNSKSIEIVHLLRQLGLSIQLCDPHAPSELDDISLTPFEQLQKTSILIMAVPHREFLQKNIQDFLDILGDDKGVIMDLNSMIPSNIPSNNHLIWRL